MTGVNTVWVDSNLRKIVEKIEEQDPGSAAAIARSARNELENVEG